MSCKRFFRHTFRLSSTRSRPTVRGLKISEPTDFRHNPEPYSSILALSREKSSDAVMKETPTQSSAALDHPLQSAVRPSSPGSGSGQGQCTRSTSVAEVHYGGSEADVI